MIYGRAYHVDASHESHELLGYVKTEAVLCTPRRHLLDSLNKLLRHADTLILHSHIESGNGTILEQRRRALRILLLFDINLDAALFTVSDGIVDQDEQDLIEPALVAVYEKPAITVDLNLDLLHVKVPLEQFDDLLDVPVRVEYGVISFQQTTLEQNEVLIRLQVDVDLPQDDVLLTDALLQLIDVELVL